MDRFHRGGPLTVTVAGGSISAGAGVVDGKSFTGWLQEALAAHLGRSVAVLAAAIPGINTGFMSLCHEAHISKSSDIIILEYTMNDMDPSGAAAIRGRPYHLLDNPVRRPMERLIRKLLNYPNRPALLMLHAYSWHKLLPYVGAFWSTYETEMHEFALFYGMPELSVKAATFQLMARGVEGYQVNRTRASVDPTRLLEVEAVDATLKGKLFYFDVWHPDGNTGARVMGEIAAQALLDVWADVKARPLTAHERWVAESQELPPPILPGNHATPTGKCLLGPWLRAAVRQEEGWSWMGTEEDKFMKWGYESETPGSKLIIRVNTTSPTTIKEQQGAPVHVELWYMVHPQFGGQAKVFCQGGCQCSQLNVSCYAPSSTETRAQLAKMAVSQSETCEVVVEVLKDSSSKPASNRFKVGGLLIAEDPMDFTIDNFAALGLLRDVIFPNKPDFRGVSRVAVPKPGASATTGGAGT